MPRHLVIIGGGFGGLKAAKALRRVSPEVLRITVIDRSNHHLFQPLLYQVATAGLSPADIASPIRAILGRQKNAEVMLGEVIGINREARKVLLKDREVAYDFLIVATGARHSYFSHPEWELHAPGLKSVDDATRIRRKVLLAFEAAEVEPDEAKRRALLNFVLVGGGPTGVEMAGSIAELAHTALASDFRHINPRSARIILLEAHTRLLAAFPEDLAENARRSLERLGVETRTGARVERVDEEGVVVAGERIPARTVIWAAGVVASPAGKWLQAEVDRAGRVKVDEHLRLPGHPEIFVIGDTALALDEAGNPLPGVAPVAMQQGKYVGEMIKKAVSGGTGAVRGGKGAASSEPGAVPGGWPATERFHYRNKGNMATVGRSSAIADLGRIHLTGFIAWVAWLLIHILYLIGFRNRVFVLINWAWSYLTFQRGARLITFDQSPEPQGSEKALGPLSLPRKQAQS